MDGEEVVEKEMKLKHRQWVDSSVTWTNVDRGDLAYVKEIVKDICLFDPSLARIKVDIVKTRTKDRYNIQFKNWNKYIQIGKFYNTFLNPETRSIKYDPILLDAGINPDPEGETEAPVLEVNISARSMHSERRK